MSLNPIHSHVLQRGIRSAWRSSLVRALVVVLGVGNGVASAVLCMLHHMRLTPCYFAVLLNALLQLVNVRLLIGQAGLFGHSQAAVADTCVDALRLSGLARVHPGGLALGGRWAGLGLALTLLVAGDLAPVSRTP